MLAYTRICRCFASRKCDDAAATLKLGHLVTPGPFLSDAAASHTNETPFGHWDTLPPLTVGPNWACPKQWESFGLYFHVGYHRIFNPQPPRPKSVENFSIHFSTHPPSGARAAWGRNVMLVNYLTHPPSGARVAWGRNVFVVYYSTHPP